MSENEKPDEIRGVASKMLHQGYLFNFFQAARLLETLLPRGKPPGETPDVSGELIRFRPHTGLVFPAADVRSVRVLDTDPRRVEIVATFMGLYGVDSPLPVYFYDDIASDTESVRPIRDFLDMFNHRLYALFYRSWKKYRPVLRFASSGADDSSQRGLCLAGLGTKQVPQSLRPTSLRLAGFAGLLSCRVRNADGLCNLLGDILETVPVSIEQNVPRWWPIPERPQMGAPGGKGMRLGDTATIGERVFDRAGKFRVVLGPLTLEQFLRLLPSGTDAPVVHHLVRLYAPDHLEFDVELRLRTDEIPPARLGDTGQKLGLTTWSGRPRREETSRIVSYTFHTVTIPPPDTRRRDTP